MVIVAVVGGAARYGMRECLNSGSRRVETDMRDDLFAHLLRQDASFYDRHPTGDVMARATNDLTSLRMVAGPALMYLVDTTMRAMLVIPAMAHISARLTLLALLPMVGLPLVMIFLGRMIHNRSLAIQTFFGVITSHVHEHISGVRVVRAYRQERAETAVFVSSTTSTSTGTCRSPMRRVPFTRSWPSSAGSAPWWCCSWADSSSSTGR